MSEIESSFTKVRFISIIRWWQLIIFIGALHSSLVALLIRCTHHSSRRRSARKAAIAMSTANDDAWMSDNSDNSDIDFDEAEPPLSIFDGLKKGFLLDKQAKRKNNASLPPRHQSEPPRTQNVPATQVQCTQNAPAMQVKSTLKEEILQELGHLQGEYGPASGEGVTDSLRRDFGFLL